MQTSEGGTGLERILSLIPGTSENTLGLGHTIRLLDALQQRQPGFFSTRSLTPAEAGAVEGSAAEAGAVDGVPAGGAQVTGAGALLGSGIAAHPWLNRLAGPVTLGAPFLCSSAPVRASALFWPFEETSRLVTGGNAGAGAVPETWIETQVLSRSALRAAHRAAQSWASERGQPAPLWVYSGWGDIESYAISALGSDRPEVIAIENLAAELGCRAGAAGLSLVALGRTAIPLFRLLKCPGWSGFGQRTPAISQPQEGGAGAALSAAFWLAQAGLSTLAEPLERVAAEISREPNEQQLELVLARIASMV